MSASSRLHALLTALAALENSLPLRTAWSEILGVPPNDVPFGRFGLPSVAALASGAREEANRAAEVVGLPLQPGLVHEWSKPVYAPGTNLDGPVHQQAVSPEALTYLDSVASVLRMRENHSELPHDDELTDLLAQMDELSASVEASTQMPDDVKRALLRRLAQMRFAVENARVGGSEGVHEAVDLLLGATAVRGKFIPTWTVSKVLALAGVAYAVFSAGPTIQASLEAWPQVAETMHLSTGGTHDTDQADEHEPAADHPKSNP